ncbi:hypothetical protein BGLT_01446 [Caballeronia glathei]|jgi:hypothetical protein|uniref:hypothetical protein n=1 Tax=Caballeronia glathei TaxID=60547 RepID=UPI0005061A80|nr:hypothetical protein [Caballeronia glathei]CDY78686.1 hypothetical protein BGLT_01446 [Caballeronia glathei]
MAPRIRQILLRVARLVAAAARRQRIVRARSMSAQGASGAASGPPVTSIVDDWYSEAINFEFEVKGVSYRGLVGYDALRSRFAPAPPAEPALAIFIRHAGEIRDAAIAKVLRGASSPVVLDLADL